MMHCTVHGCSTLFHAIQSVLNWCGLPKLHLVDVFQHALGNCVGKLKAKVKPWTVEICGIKDFNSNLNWQDILS